MKSATIIFMIASCCSTTNGATLHNQASQPEFSETAIKNQYLNASSVLYEGKYEITKIYFPLFTNHTILFFVEAQRNGDGSITDKGLYVSSDIFTKPMDTKKIKKLLETCKGIDGDLNGNVFFASNNGLYIYNAEGNFVDRYGPINDSLISVTVDNTSTIYVLTENHVLYNIQNYGDIKYEINELVKDAKDIAFNKLENALYYYDVHNKPYVLKNGVVKKIDGLPETENASYFKMLKPPIVMEGIFFLVNDHAYFSKSDGTSTPLGDCNVFLKYIKPTAFSMESGFLLHYSYDKKIYEINVLEQVVTGVVQGMFERAKEMLRGDFSFLYN